MKTAHFNFDNILTALLTRRSRTTASCYCFSGSQSAKHLIESLGIPHTEVGSLTAKQRPISMNYVVQDGDEIEVLSAGLTEILKDEPRFVLDGHLGRLNSNLRMLGMDCLYQNDFDDDELAHFSSAQNRILLTRDHRLLMRKLITQGYLVRNLDPKEQLPEIVRRFCLSRWIRPFRRCIRCNSLLVPVQKQTVFERLEPLTRKYFDEFSMCDGCKQIYWKGSHLPNMQRVIAAIISQSE